MDQKNALKYKIFIFLGIIIVIILVVVIALDQRQRLLNRNNGPVHAPVLINQGSTNKLNSGELAPSVSVTPVATVSPQVLKKTRSIATGTSLVTPNNIVVTPQGVPVKLNVVPAAADAPQQSIPLNLSQIKNTANTVKMTVNSRAFTPNTFTVQAGQLVNFVLTSTDNYTHIFMPKDPALTAIILGVAGHETRAKSWNAPKKGIYKFYDAIPGRQGVTGEMIVN